MKPSWHQERQRVKWACPAVARAIVRLLCGFVLGAGSALPVFTGSASTSAPRSLDELRARIGEHIGRPRFDGATWGIHILSLDTGRTVFQHNAGTRLRPASNAKLFTAALALDQLGPDYRIRTSILALHRPDRSGTIPGDLIIRGRGDFSMAARFHDGDHDRVLIPLVQAIERAGVRRIGGGLVGDATWFHGPPYGAGWAWEDLRHAYGAEVSALIHEDNVVALRIQPGSHPGQPCRISTLPATDSLVFVNRTVTGRPDDAPWIELQRPLGGNRIHLTGQLPLHGVTRVDAVPVHNPALWFVTRLREALDGREIRSTDPPRSMDWLTPAAVSADREGLMELAAVESPPMRDLLGHMLKRSQNLYAQALWLHVGAAVESKQSGSPNNRSDSGVASRRSTSQAASAALDVLFATAGIPSHEVLLEEGSGLSRRALVTPRAVVRLLEQMDRHPHAAVFRAALPVAGKDGNLSRRMQGTVAEGNVTGKTGMLAHTHTLSGYVRTAAGERLAFALLLNNHVAESTAAARADLDTIAILLAEFQPQSAPDR